MYQPVCRFEIGAVRGGRGWETGKGGGGVEGGVGRAETGVGVGFGGKVGRKTLKHSNEEWRNSFEYERCGLGTTFEYYALTEYNI